jgi:hypothetical protein
VLKRQLTTFLLLVGIAVGQNKSVPGQSVKPETPHLDFVKEYVRELIEDENLKTSAEKELSETKSPLAQFSTGIYFSTSVQLELGSQINVLKTMRLDPPYEDLITGLIELYQDEIDLHQSLIDIETKFLEGPKPGVDYSALGAKMPQFRAGLESAQKAVFEATGLIFITLIDPKADSKGHTSHLLITRAEKSDLQDQLEIILKGQSDKGDHDYYISSAMVLREVLLKKGYKCADEPWE